MGALKMLGLMLWKAIVQRKRQPLVLFLEIIWPVIIFLVVVLVRRTAPPIPKPTCYYAPRALPNSGYRFIQSFVCGLDNECHEREDDATIRMDPRMAQFLQAVSPLYSDANNTRKMIDDLPKAQEVFKGLNNMIEDPNIKELIGMKLRVADVFKDPDKVRSYFVDRGILDGEIVDAILQAEFNISRIYDLTKFVDFKAIACDPNQLKEFLVVPSPVGIGRVSQTLCNINDSLVPDIVRETQKQLSLSKMIRLMAKLEKALGDYDNAMMMEDVSNMLDVLTETSALGDLLKSAPGLQNVTKWANKAIQYLTQDLNKIDIKSWEEIITDLEPLVEMQVGQSPWWEDLKKVLTIAYVGFEWTQKGIQDLHDMPLKLGDLISKNEDDGSWIQETFNVSMGLMHLLSEAELDILKMSQQLEWFVSNPDAYRLLCVQPGFAQLFKHPTKESHDGLESFQQSLCQLDPEDLNKYFTDLFNYNHLIARVEKIQNDQLDLKLSSLNWTDLYITSKKLLESALSITDYGEEFFDSSANLGGFQNMWQQLAQSVQRSLGWSATHEINLPYQLQPAVETLNAVAVADENFNRELHKILSSLEIVTDMLKTIRDRFIGLPQQFKMLAEENPEFTNVMKQLLQSEDLMKALLEVMTDSKKRQIIIDNMDDLNAVFCDEVMLNRLFTDQYGKVLVAADQARELLCNKNLEDVARELAAAFDISDLQQKAEEWVNNLQTFNPTKTVNITKLLNDINEFFTYAYPQDSWQALLETLGISPAEFDAYTLGLQLSNIQTTYTNAILYEMAEQLGPILEASPIWPQVAPLVKSAFIYAELSLAEGQFLMEILRNDSAFSVLLYQGMEYGPRIMSAMAQSLSDPQKIEEVTADLAWATRICKPDCEEFYNLFDIPQDIPLEGVIQTVRGTMDAVWANNEVIASVMKDIESVDSTDKLNWTRFAGILEASTALSVHLQGVTYDAYAQLFTGVSRFMKPLQDVYAMLIKLSQSNTQGVSEMTSNMMTMLDQAFGNSLMNVSDVIKYYMYHSNQLFDGTNQLMEKMKDGSMSMENLMANSTMLKSLYDEFGDLMPQTMDAIKNTVLNPQKMMAMMFQTDFKKVNLCQSFQITNTLEFTDEEQAAKFEKKLCNTTYMVELGNEILRTNPELGKLSNQIMVSVVAVTNFNVTNVPKEYDMDMKEYLDNLVKFMQNMMNMTNTGESLERMVPYDLVNTTTMAKSMEDFDKSFKNMNLNSLMSMTSMMKYLMPMLQNLTGDPELIESLESSIEKMMKMNSSNTEEYMANLMAAFDEMLPLLTNLSSKNPATASAFQQLKIYNAYYAFMVNILTKISETGYLDVSSFLSSKMKQALLVIGPDAMQIILKDVVDLMANQSRIQAILASLETMGTFCTDDNAYRDFLPSFAEVLQANTALKDLLCGDKNKTIVEILGSLASDEVLEYTSILMGISGSSSSFSLSGLVENSKKAMVLLGQIDPSSVNITFGPLADIVSEAMWAKFSQEASASFSHYFKDVNALNVTQFLQQSLFASMGQFFAGIPPDVLTQLNQYVIYLTNQMESWAGGDVSLQELHEGFPETQKLLTNIKYFPVLYDAYMYTVVLNSQDALNSAMASGWDGLCGGEAYKDLFLVPANRRAEFEMAMQDLCSINMTVVTQEMMTKWTVPSSNEPVTAETLALNLKTLIELALKVPQSRWSQNYDWFYKTNWTSSWTAVYSMLQSPEDIQQLAASMIQQYSSLTPEMKFVLSYIDAISKFLQSSLDINELPSAIAVYPNLQRYFSMMDKQDELMQVMISSAMHQSKLQDFIKQLNVNPDYCTDPSVLDDFLTIPDGVDIDKDQIGELLCKFNITALYAEIQELYMQMMAPILNVPTDETVNVTALVARILSLQNHLPTLTDPSTLSSLLKYNSSVWQNVFAKLEAEFANLEQQGTDQLIQALGGTLRTFVEANQLNALVNPWNIAFNLLSEKMELATNRTSFVLRDFFPGSPTLQKLADLMENTPDIVSIIISSFNNPKFNELMQDNLTVALVKLCHPMSVITDYIVVPDGVNLSQLRTQFCELDMEALVAEAMKEIHLGEQPVADTVDWTKLVENYYRFREKYDSFKKNLPVLDMSKQWTNASAWLDAMSAYMQVAENPQAAADSYSAMLGQLIALMENNNTDLNSLRLVAAYMDVLRERLQALPSKNITLGDVFKDTPALRSFVEKSLSLTPDIIEAVLRSNILNFQGFINFYMELLSKNDQMVYICSKDAQFYRDLIGFPDTINVEGALQLLCKTHDQELLGELMKLLGVDEVQQNLANSQLPFNLTTYMATYDKFNKALQHLIANATFDATNLIDPAKIEAVLQRVIATNDFRDLDAVLKMYWRSMEPLFNTPEIGDMFKTYFNTMVAVMDYFNDVTDQLKGKGSNIQLSDLLGDELINEFSKLTPDLINVLSRTKIRYEKITQLGYVILLASGQPEVLLELLCNSDYRNQYFILPDDIDADGIIATVCNLNATQLTASISSNINYTELAKKIIAAGITSITYDKFVSTYKQFRQSLAIFSNHSYADFMENFMDEIASIYNLTWSQLQQMPDAIKYLQQMGLVSDGTELESYGQLLNSLHDFMGQDSRWEEATQAFRGAQLFMDVISGKIDKLPKTEITIGDVLGRSQNTLKLVTDAFALAPEIYKSIMDAQVDLAQLANTANSTNVVLALCDGSLLNIKDPSAEQEKALKLICETDYAAIVEELEEDWNWPALRTEFERIVARTDNYTIDWVQFVDSNTRFFTTMTAFFTNFTVPSLEEFMLYNGNMTEWLQKFNQVWATPAADSTNEYTKWVADWLQKQGEENPEAMKFFDPYMPYMKAIQLFARHMRARLEPLPLNMTVTQLLKEDVYLSGFLKDAFAATPDLLGVLSASTIDQEMLMEVLQPSPNITFQNLLCENGVVTYPSEQATNTVKESFCDLNVDLLQQEFFNFIDWNNIVTQLSGVSVPTPASTFNWTAYMEDLTWIQMRITQQIMGPGSLADFFEYKAGMNDWLARLQKAFDNTYLKNDELDNILTNFLTSLSKSLPGTYPALISHVNNALTSVIDAMNQYLTFIIQDSLVSLNDVLLDSNKLRSVLEATIDFTKNPEVLDALLNGNMSTNLMTSLLTNTDVVKNFCTQSLADEFVLPEEVSLSLATFQQELCSLDLEAIIQELQPHVDIQKVLQEFSKITTTLNEENLKIPKMSPLSDSITQLESTIRKLLSGNYQPDSDLTNTVTTWFSAIEKVFNQQMTSLYADTVKNALESALAPFNLTDPWSSQVLNATSSWLTDILGMMSNGSVIPPSKFEELFKQLVTIIPDDATANANIADMLTKPFFETMALIPGLNNYLCNMTYWQAMVTKLGINAQRMQGALCNTSTELWYDKLLNEGLSEQEVHNLFNMLRNWTAGAFPTVDLTLRIPPLKDFATDYSSTIIKLLEGLNLTDNFDMTSLQVQKLVQDLTAIIVSETNMTLQDRFVKISMKMKEFDGIMQDNPFWNVFEQYAYAASLIMNYAGDQIQKFNDGESSLLDITSLVPNEEALTDLLNQFLSPEVTEALLKASINVNTAAGISAFDDFSKLICNRTRFSSLFNLEDPSTIDTVQSQLCSAVQNNSVVIENLLQFVQLQSLIAEIEESLKTSAVPDDFWTNFPKMMQNFVNNLMLMLSENVELMDTSSLNALANALANVNSMDATSWANVNNMCTLVVTSPVATDYVKSLMGRMQFYTQMTVTALQSMPSIETMLCSIETANLTTLYNIFKNSPLQELTYLSTQLFSGKDFEVDCSELATLQDQFNILLNQSMQDLGRYLNSSLTCISNTVDKKIPALMEMDELSSLLRDVIDLFETAPGLDDTNEIRPVLKMVLKSMLRQQEIQVKVAEMFQNTTTLKALFTSLTDLTPYMFEAAMESSLNINLIPLYNMTSEEIRDILCQPDKLKDLLHQDAKLPINWSDVSRALCTSDINETISVLLDSINAGKAFLSLVEASDSYNVDVDWLMNIMSNLNNVFKDIDQLSSLASIFENLDFTTLMEVLPDIQQFLVDNGPNRIFDSLDATLNSLQRAVAGDPQAKSIFEDMKIVASGIRGLNFMKRYLPTSVVLRDLLEDPNDFQQFLESDLKFSKEMASAVLNSSIAFSKLLNLSSVDVANEICNAQNLGQLLTFNLTNTRLTEDDISEQLCKVDENTATQVGDYLIQEMDVGQLIKNLLSFSPDSILKKVNITKEDLNSLSNTFQELQSSLGSTLKLIANATSLFDIEELISPTSEKQKASAALGSLSDLICGRNNAFNVKDSYGTEENLDSVPVRSKRDTEESERKILPIDVKEMDQLKTQFCKDMYLEITSTTTGKIVWIYLKPLILGKIPFAPDTPMTRAIMEEAMAVVNDILELQILSDGLSNGIYDLADMANLTAANTQGIKDSLSNAFISSALSNILGTDPQKLFDSLGSFNAIGQKDANIIATITKLISNITECIETDRLEGYATEEELEERARQLSETHRALAGVVFMVEDSTQSGYDPVDKTMPRHIKYKIRTDVENVPSTERVEALIWEPGPEDDLANDMRYLRGFVELQEMIDKAIIRLQTNQSISLPKTEVKQLPYPCYERDRFGGMISRYFVPIMMCLGWMVAIANGVRIIVYDRERQIEETMKVMGLKAGINWMSWFISNFIIMLIMAFIIVLFLKLGALMRFTDPVLLWVFLACFSLAVTMLCYLISVFFNRTTLAALTALMVYLISYLPYVLVISMGSSLLFWHKAVMALSCTTALSMGTQIIANFEQQGVGVRWDTAQNMVYYKNNTFTFTWCCYMLLIDAAVYGIIGWYISNVFPGKYGISQPWYFPVSPSYWGCKSKKPKKMYKHNITNFGPSNAKGHMDDPKAFAEFLKTPSNIRPGEADPSDLPVGISLNHLTKKYSKSKRPAVEDLSVNLYQDQISALLGHNGAGKTSTINMLTGVHEATGGTAYVNGMELHSRSTDIRQQMGFCPQHDALFDYLTVYEHLEFYCDLKSKGSKKEKKQEVQEFLDLVGLRPSMHVKACHLSGGQKRRLSVALAFIGGSNVIILDEPTSGIDPAARRSIWNLIVKHREGRTILLCTHHLDEADALGDRIVILHQGKLVVSGSPMYLKREFGSGYNMTVAKAMTPFPLDAEKRALMHSDMSMCTSSAVLSFIQQTLPGTRLVEEIGSEITFVLPADTDHRQKFQQLFERLETHKQQLHISSYGVSDTSLEEVFLKLTLNAELKGDLDAQRIRKMDINEALLSDSALSTLESSIPSSPSLNYDKATRSSATSSTLDSEAELTAPGRMDKGCQLKMRQFWALLVKRFHHNCRDYRSYLSQIILPCIFVALAMGFTMIKPQPHDLPSLRLSPELMHQSANFFRLHQETKPETDYVNSLFTDPGLGTTCMRDMPTKQSMCTYTAGPWRTTEVPEDQRHLYENPGDCECTDGGQKCPVGSGGMPPPYWQMAQGVSTYNITASQFTTADYFLRTWTDFSMIRWWHGGVEFEKRSKETNAKEEEMIATVWYFNKGWHMPAYLNTLSNMILRGSLRSDQRVNQEDFGITVYSHPLPLTKGQLSRQSFMQGLADTGIALCILCAFCFVPAGFAIYLINENVHKEKRLQFICGVGTIMYWGTAFLWDMMSYCLTVGLATAIAAAFQIPIYTANLNLAAFVVTLLLFGWAVIPLMYLMVRVFSDATTGYMVLFLFNLLFGINTTALVFLLGLFEGNSEAIREAYDIISKVFLIFPQFSLGDCLVKIAKNQLYTDIYERFNIDFYKNPFSFEMLGWNFVAFGILGAVFAILNLFLEIRCRCCNSKEQNDHSDEDEDVRNEAERVASGSAKDDLVTLKSLSKVYRRGIKKFSAVKDISVGIPKGQCFGLLGVNGAGKTTSFNMITGEIAPTAGRAVFKGRVISQYHPDMDQDVGYCPQSEALDPLCSVEEVLYTFCRLKGIPGSMMKKVCTSVLKRFSLEAYAKRTVHKLSGGTKRKLSTAVALLGDPSLVLLDEPTTGMDPKTRRLVWNNILRVLREDRSVILTSHSMAECDALCTRMAIMVNGRFKCLGTGQHLKDKYGTGYTLTLRTGNRRDVMRVINYVQTTFPGSKVKDQHLNQVTMETPFESTRLSLIFGNLEQDRHKLGIVDYSVRQTTLDQIFVNFARAQTDGVTEIEETEVAEEEARGGIEDYPHTSPKEKPSLRGYPPSQAAANPYSRDPTDPSQVEVAVITGPHSQMASPSNVSVITVNPPPSDTSKPDDDNVTIVTVM